MEEVLLDMYQRNVDILCLAETWRCGSEEREHDDLRALLLMNGLTKKEQTRRKATASASYSARILRERGRLLVVNTWR
jgi:hypothetical protein